MRSSICVAYRSFVSCDNKLFAEVQKRMNIYLLVINQNSVDHQRMPSPTFKCTQFHSLAHANYIQNTKQYFTSSLPHREIREASFYNNLPAPAC